MPSDTYGVLEAVVPEASAELWDLWCTELGASGSEWKGGLDAVALRDWTNPQDAAVRATEAETPPHGSVRIRHYFKTMPQGDPHAWLAAFRARYPGAAAPAKVDWSQRPVEPWATQWRQYFAPFPVRERWIICPPWDAGPTAGATTGAASPTSRNPQTPGKPVTAPSPATLGEPVIPPLRIVIDPGQGFGTGRHASTALALQLIERALTGEHPSPARVLDVGTGSGILLIAARLLGAGGPWACDIDPAVEPELRRNLALSGCEDRPSHPLVFHLGTPADLLARNAGAFPLVMANLTAPLLIQYAEALRRLTSPGGHLILSGMLTGEVSSVLQAFQGSAWMESGRAEMDGWCAVSLSRRTE